MDNKKRALGRGLEALFDNEAMDFDKLENKIVNEAKPSDIIEVKIEELRSNPYQPRKNFDEATLNELANSIKEHGVFQPIIVKKTIKGYEIVAGERRTKASKLAGKNTIPAIIQEFTDTQMMEIALLENLQREDLSAIEEAMAYKNIIDNLDITQEELAKRVGKSRSHITNMLGLLRLPLEVQDMVLQKEISMGHARVLSKLEDNKRIEALAKKIIEENLSVRAIENIVSQKVEEKVEKRVKEVNKEHQQLESYMKYKLGTKVNISDKKIEIMYTTTEDLKRITDILNIKYED